MSTYKVHLVVHEETVRCSREMCEARIRPGNIAYREDKSGEILCPDCHADMQSLFACEPALEPEV